MATKITKIQLRRDSELNWGGVNPTLSDGEIGYVNLSAGSASPNAGRFKIGDGVTNWNNLGWFGREAEGDFLIVTENGPFEGDITWDVLAKYKLGDILDANGDPVIADPRHYSSSAKGIRVAGVATDGDIFPVPLDGGQKLVHDLGKPEARFRSLIVGDQGIRIGNETGDHEEITLTHQKGASINATLKVLEVSNLTGGVTKVGFITSPGGILPNPDYLGADYYEATGVATKYTSTNQDPSINTGEGLRVDINSVGPAGSVLNVSIRDGGAGYKAQEEVHIDLPSQLFLTRNDRNPTAVATQESLSKVTSQALPLRNPSFPNSPSPRVSYLESTPQALPSTDGIRTQEGYNAWVTASLAQLEGQKVQTLDCTSTGDGSFGNGSLKDPEYKTLINIGIGRVHPTFVRSFAGPMAITNPNLALYGGEIFSYDKTSDLWSINAGGGSGGGNEVDPLFSASDANRLQEQIDPMGTEKVLTYVPSGSPVEPTEVIMYRDNWKSIGRL